MPDLIGHLIITSPENYEIISRLYVFSIASMIREERILAFTGMTRSPID
jgi:hypothetical protein